MDTPPRWYARCVGLWLCGAGVLFIPPPAMSDPQGFFCGTACSTRHIFSAVIYNIVFIVFQSPVVQYLRETSRDRNGDTTAACGFFMVLRSGTPAFFHHSMPGGSCYGSWNGQMV